MGNSLYAEIQSWPHWIPGESKRDRPGEGTVPATHSTQRFSPGLTEPQVRVKGTERGKGLSRQLTLRRDSVLASLDPK
jgi:hypothetical protein